MENLSFLDAILLFQGAGAVSYICFLFVISIGLSRLNGEPSSTAAPIVLVVIPARNEVANIESCLTHLPAQSYSAERYEIIVVDDHSDDGTLALCRGLANKEKRISVLPLGDDAGVSPKKAALKNGHSTGTRRDHFDHGR